MGGLDLFLTSVSLPIDASVIGLDFGLGIDRGLVLGLADSHLL